MIISSEPLIAEVPSTDGFARYERTGWVRISIVENDGTVWIIDCREEHMRRRPPGSGAFTNASNIDLRSQPSSVAAPALAKA